MAKVTDAFVILRNEPENAPRPEDISLFVSLFLFLSFFFVCFFFLCLFGSFFVSSFFVCFFFLFCLFGSFFNSFFFFSCLFVWLFVCLWEEKIYFQKFRHDAKHSLSCLRINSVYML